MEAQRRDLPKSFSSVTAKALGGGSQGIFSEYRIFLLRNVILLGEIRIYNLTFIIKVSKTIQYKGTAFTA